MEYVEYVGLAHRRVITDHDWRSIGIGDGSFVIWHAQNGFAVPAHLFTDRQLEKAIEPDPDFVVRDFTPTPRPGDMTPRELRESVENPVDVLDMLNQAAQPRTTDSGPTPPVFRDDSEPTDR
jgi:hypothetical protein